MILSTIFEVLSPPKCLICNKEGQSMCLACWQNSVATREPACFLCNSLSKDSKTCLKCRRKSSVKGATIPYRLDGAVKEVIYNLKYFGNKNIAKSIAVSLVEFLPNKSFDSICFVPATGRSQRKRGYNQSALIAKELSRLTGVKLSQKIIRINHTDQIGLNREQRFRAVENNFVILKSCKDENILLVDDVVTTGATINECSRVLSKAGAKSIWALGVAKK